MSKRVGRLTREERSWVLYDVANSAFTLIIVTTIMPIFFSNVASAGIPANRSTALWGYTSAIASLILAVAAPVLGAMGDYRGNKRRLFLTFVGSGVGITFLFATIGEGMAAYALVLFTIGFVAYAGANLIYDSFLTDVTTNERMDSVSTRGFAWGYIGSVVPFILVLALSLYPDIVGGALTATRISFAITGTWWLGFSIPMARNVRQHHGVEPDPHPVLDAFRRVASTFKQIRRHREASVFLLAYFFYIDGVDTIIRMATSYATEIGFAQAQLIVVILAIQVVAFPFALLYGGLAKRFGTKPMLFTGIGVYFVIVVLGFFLPVLPSGQVQNTVFWIMAMLVATSQGGIQALSRSYFGALIPKNESGKFFGFYNIFGKFAAIIGPLLLGLLADITGESRWGVLSLALLFAIGAVLLARVHKEDATSAPT
ncbi:MAG: MFS transporter [Spirochaetota bacterium]